MQIILLESLSKIGKAGEVVSVKDGYAKNYLIPKNKAIVANKTNLTNLKDSVEKINLNNKFKIEEANSLKQKIDKKSFKITMEANEDGNLYGAITQQQVIKSISIDHELLNPESVILPQIKTIGNHSVSIRIYEDIKASITIAVEKKNK